MIFIDGNNFYRSASALLGSSPSLDYTAMARELCGPGRRLMRTYYYSALSERSDNPTAHDAQKKFLNTLQTLPRFQVVIGYLQKKAVPGKKIDITDKSTYVHVEKGTDVNIATDMLSLAYDDGFDVAILVSGDSDYLRVIEKVRARGKVVEVAICQGASASILLRNADDKIIMDHNFFAKCSLSRTAAAPTSI